MKNVITMKNGIVRTSALALLLALLGIQQAGAQTMRGDFSMDGQVNVTDISMMINYMLNDALPVAETQMDTITVKGVSFVMVHVQGGTYSRELGKCYTVGDFSIGQTEVTNELWYAVMEDIAWPEDYWQRAVVNKSRVMCDEFIARLNELTGLEFMLPSEDEWEYAAAGGRLTHGYLYAGSNNIDEVAWYIGNRSQIGYKPAPVATKAPNELGLYDMSGNVSEWCRDFRSLPESSEYGAVRGGTYYTEPGQCRVSAIMGMLQNNQGSTAEGYGGLRLVLH